MTTMAQGWVLLGILGVLATGTLALVALSQQSLRGFLEARFDAVDARFATVDARFATVDARFDAVDRRFDGVDARIASLDRDVQTLVNRVFRDRP